MKILTYISALLFAICAFQSVADVPNQVVMHYTGTIVIKPCDISIGATTTLDMGDVDIATLSTKDATTPWLKYGIYFTDCDMSTNIMLSSSMDEGDIWNEDANTCFNIRDAQSTKLKDVCMDVFATENNIDMWHHFNYYDLPGYGPIPILPHQRSDADTTNVTVPIQFRFRNITGNVPPPGAVTGTYILVVEYN